LKGVRLTSVGTFIYENTACRPGFPSPHVTFPAAYSNKTKAIEFNLTVVATLYVPEQNEFTKTIVRWLSKSAWARYRTTAVVEPITFDMPFLCLIHN
jgi:hypothetical protein